MSEFPDGDEPELGEMSPERVRGRVRWAMRIACCTTDLVGTKRIRSIGWRALADAS